MHLISNMHRSNTQGSSSLHLKTMAYSTQFLNDQNSHRIITICLVLLGCLVLSFTSYDVSSAQANGDTYIVQRGDTLSKIAKQYGSTTSQLVQANGLDDPNLIWVGQRLTVSGYTDSTSNNISTDSATGSTDDVSYTENTEDTNNYYSSIDPIHNSLMATGQHWIEVDLSEQLLTAWDGDTPIMSSYISGGKEETPTVLGRFSVNYKLTKQDMRGDDYELPDVPWVMYFFEDYAIHGAYWHNVFGTPRSHGCVNMKISDAQWLYEWSPYGTEVYIHE